uniref:Protein Nef n=1 Tax=Human immunodeficiency virus type 1 TaxID=11676 RepID=A0A0B5GL89_HV1|nr:nef protein [Human immunodeficiency virus 1]
MGGKWSKRSAPGWNTIRERMRRTEPGRTEPAAEGVGAVSRDLEQPGAITTSTTNSADGVWLEAQEEEEEDFPVIPLVPLTPMTSMGALDLFHFLREKGGLEGLIRSQQTQDILDLRVYRTHRYFRDCHNCTPCPGIRYPLTFVWCFRLLPVKPEEVEEANDGENNNLLHLMNLHDLDDPEGQVLMWKFDNLLPLHHMDREKHQKYYYDC